MANSKYEYVREFEHATDHRLLSDAFIVVRVDGQCFHRFSKDHNFLKPNDKRCLDLMNRSAIHVMRSFYPNIILAYGQSDEYSFVLRRLTNMFKRRQNKITSLVTSAFTAAFIYHWNEFFTQERNIKLTPAADAKIDLNQTLKYPATFDGRCVLYPNETRLMDYLKWRQVDCHINNLHNTTFYALTGEYCQYKKIDDERCNVLSPYRGPKPDLFPLSVSEATQKLSGTSSGDKNEILFSDYGINYNNELEQFRKGTIIALNVDTTMMLEEIQRTEGARSKKKSRCGGGDNSTIQESIENMRIEELFDVMHIDIISETFWSKYEPLIKL